MIWAERIVSIDLLFPFAIKNQLHFITIIV
jgi:hypothetical protein